MAPLNITRIDDLIRRRWLAYDRFVEGRELYGNDSVIVPSHFRRHNPWNFDTAEDRRDTMLDTNIVRSLSRFGVAYQLGARDVTDLPRRATSYNILRMEVDNTHTISDGRNVRRRLAAGSSPSSGPASWLSRYSRYG